MARSKKEYKIVNMRLDAELADKLWALAEERGQTYTMCLERILREYFDKQEAPEKQ